MQVRMNADLAQRAQSHLSRLIGEQFASRLFERDATLWGQDAAEEASQRLGWVDSPLHADEIIRRAESIRETFHMRGISEYILCGMGGSSLGPEVLARAAGASLTVLDTTHPTEIARALDRDLSTVGIIVSSKSGSTIETATQLAACETALLRQDLRPQDHIVCITDPGSPLSARAAEGFDVVLADPTVGGRFSVFTAFGLVPAVLIGAETEQLIRDAQVCRERVLRDASDNPALQLAAGIAASLPEQYVLLLKERTEHEWGLAAWIEQLVAESTGKHGRGVLPVDATATVFHDFQTSQTQEVTFGDQLGLVGALTVSGSLGAQFMIWECATAALGMLLGVNPFDQPDVESAKVAAREAMDSDAMPPSGRTAAGSVELSELPAAVRNALPEGGYVAIQAFVDRASDEATAVRALQDTLVSSLGVPVSLGWGPRYLHSVGQFHKGGIPKGVFVQVIDEALSSVATTESAPSFGKLILAQAAGDREVLRERGMPVLLTSVTT